VGSVASVFVNGHEIGPGAALERASLINLSDANLPKSLTS
jgi:hypothetical protein